MSEQNKQTLEAYQKTAQRYLENTKAHAALDPEKAERKQIKLEQFLAQSFAKYPEGANIFEIGSADGVNAAYLCQLGFNVMASDVADGFLQELAAKRMKLMKFNVLTDDFPQKYNGVLAWRVFVHFTPEDAAQAIQKIHDALEDGGRFVFNVINRDFKGVMEEWADFPGEYHMDVERYFYYHSKEELDAILADVGFHIVDFHEEGGETGNKWLVYVVEK